VTLLLIATDSLDLAAESRLLLGEELRAQLVGIAELEKASAVARPGPTGPSRGLAEARPPRTDGLLHSFPQLATDSLLQLLILGGEMQPEGTTWTGPTARARWPGAARSSMLTPVHGASLASVSDRGHPTAQAVPSLL